MSWKNIKDLVAEHFRQLHFVVEENKEGGEEGYLIAKKGEEKYLIKTRQWKSSAIGADTVQECIRAVTAIGATGGILVTSGYLTGEAKGVAKAGRITLLGGEELHTRIMNSAEALDAELGKGAGPRMKKILWIGLVLLVIGAGSTLLSSSKSSQTLSTIWTAVQKKFALDQHGPAGANKKIGGSAQQKGAGEQRFTDEQIRRAGQSLLHEKEEKQYQDIEMGKTEKGKKYYYEIELVSGGHIFSNKVNISGDKITYRNNRGLVTSLSKNEVKSMKKIEIPSR